LGKNKTVAQSKSVLSKTGKNIAEWLAVTAIAAITPV
jgi:hypothetical protein